MINEIERAEELLSGQAFKKEYFFTAYCVLIKYYINLGLRPMDIKTKILEWEEKYKHSHYFELNDVILKYYEDKISVRGEFKVNISEQDIFEINRRFSKKNQKKIAFAMLCFAKVCADKNGCFYMSFPELGEWINIHANNIKTRYIKDILLFDYIERIDSAKSTFTWDRDKNKNYYHRSKYKIKVDYSNNFEGKWVLTNNNILELYDEIFTK